LKGKKWINRALNVSFIAIILLVVFVIISTKVSGGEPNLFGYELKMVLSGSMEPAIKTGSVIAVKPVTDPNVFQVGDVITYHAMDDYTILITHRIVEVINDGSGVKYVTKGDSNDAIDPTPIPANHVAAHYVNFTIPYMGFLIEFAKSKVGIVMLVILPGILLILSQIVSIWRTITSMGEDEKAESTTVKEPF
jgi:signal peptidase